MYNICILINSFKDVFTPQETMKVLINSIPYQIKQNTILTTISISDGGEFATNSLFLTNKYKSRELNNIVSAYQKEIKINYLQLDQNSIFIGSSDILRIPPELDEYKNPLQLTTYGLGQAIKQGIKQGAENIYLGLGGTNTTDCGIGMAQALGCNFYDIDNNLIKPKNGNYFVAEDLEYIFNIDTKKSILNSKIYIETLCDGKITINQMDIPNNQKIGIKYNNNKSYISEKIKSNIFHYTKVVNKQFDKELFNKAFYGVAGGINISLDIMLNLQKRLGVDFFIEQLDVINAIKKADLIITGEGKFDNSINGKMPIGISNLARKYNKEVLYIVGDIDKKLKPYFKGYLSTKLPKELKENGITTMISCHNHYKEFNLDSDITKYKIYKEETPKILQKALHTFFLNKGLIK